MTCAWRWCSNTLPEPVENAFCNLRHANKWARLFDNNRPAAMSMLRARGWLDKAV